MSSVDSNRPSSPPFYVLLAQTPLSNVSAGALSNTLAHPTIQYHYADDLPLSILRLPTHPNESVLVLDYDPESAQPTVQSISNNLVVNGLRVEEAPGAAADDSKTHKNISMFIIEATINDHITVSGDRKSPRVTLGQFKHRNKILRRIIEYPSNKPHCSGVSDTTANPSSLAS